MPLSLSVPVPKQCSGVFYNRMERKLSCAKSAFAKVLFNWRNKVLWDHRRLEANHDTEKIDGDLCERCSVISWETLIQSVPGSVLDLFDTTRSSQDLRSSDCRICRIMGDTLSSTTRDPSPTRVVRLRWFREITQGDIIGRIQLCCGVENGSLYTVSELLVYDNDIFVKGAGDCNKGPAHVDFRLAKHWIRDCGSMHEECKCSSRAILRNLKVLDCFSKTIVSAPNGCEFVALSYVWGRPEVDETTQFPRLPSSLPRTIEDSIEATKMLGYRYLWVDKYCIDQGNAQTQHDQINQMGAIYSAAYVTLIAAAGTDSFYGLPGVLRKRKNPEFQITIGRLLLARSLPSAIDDIHRSVWASRAWTFQESYFSRRRLYFTEHQLIYICEKLVQCDFSWSVVPNERHKLADLGASLPLKSSECPLATAMIKEYSRRHLTYESDTLNAIVGALNTLPEVDHIWGVTLARIPWTFDIAIALHWKHLSPSSRRMGFPSWSPLGWRGAVEYLDQVQPVVSSTCSLEFWHKDRFKTLPDAFGNLNNRHHPAVQESSKYLRLTTTIVMLDFEQVDTFGIQSGLYVKVPYNQDLVIYLHPFWDLDVEHFFQDKPIRLPCAVIVRHNADVARLEAELMVVILQQHEQHYERIGCFHFASDRAFARDKQGRNVYLPSLMHGFRKYGDGLFWMKGGEECIFLLG